MLKIRIATLLGMACLVFFFQYAHAAPPQSLESFGSEFEWIDAKQCVVPKGIPPSRIWISDPNDNVRTKKISVRRWMDEDGDGICELYDVKELEQSFFSQKIYGYPVKRMEYKDGKWEYISALVDNWFPLILLDKKTGERMRVTYTYGNAGYSASARGVPVNCELLREVLAVGYMLIFRFPAYAKKDEVTDPNGNWNDVVSGWIFSQYSYRDNVFESKLPSECKEKYRLVIDALAKKLEH